MYTTFGTYYSFQMTVCCPRWNPSRRTDSHLKRILSTKCCIHAVVPPDDGPIYARNMQRLTKYTKLCIKLVFLHTRTFTFFIQQQLKFKFPSHPVNGKMITSQRECCKPRLLHVNFITFIYVFVGNQICRCDNTSSSGFSEHTSVHFKYSLLRRIH